MSSRVQLQTCTHPQRSHPDPPARTRCDRARSADDLAKISTKSGDDTLRRMLGTPESKFRRCHGAQSESQPMADHLLHAASATSEKLGVRDEMLVRGKRFFVLGSDLTLDRPCRTRTRRLQKDLSASPNPWRSELPPRTVQDPGHVSGLCTSRMDIRAVSHHVIPASALSPHIHTTDTSAR